VHTAVRGVQPAHWQHVHPHVQCTGQHQHFHVEGEAIQRLPTEDGPGCIAPERLESALRICDARHTQGLHQRIEDTPHVAPQGTLWLLYTTARQRAAANQHVGVRLLLKMGEESLHFLKRRGQVRVHEQHDVATGPQYAASHRIAFAAVHQVVDDLKARISLYHRPSTVQSVVLGALNHEQDFDVQRMAVEVVADLQQGLGHSPRLVPGGNHD